MIRNLRPGDLLRFSPHNELRAYEHAITLDRVGKQGGGGVFTPVSLLREGVGLKRNQCLWVAEEAGEPVGVAAGRMRAGPRAWEVSHLYTAPNGDEESATALLEQVCSSAARHGACRVFLRLPEEDPLTTEAMRAGFRPLFQEILFRQQVFLPGQNSSTLEGFRRCRPMDDMALFQLFLASTPALVRNACALTLEDWRDSQEGDRRKEVSWVYQPTAGLARGRVVEWSSSGAHYLAVEALPTEPALSSLVDCSISLYQRKMPLWVLVPDFYGDVCLELQARGFTPELRFTVFIRPIAALVSDVAFAAASA